MSRHMFTAERVVWGGASEASDGGYIIVQDGVIVSCGTGDSVAKAASEEQRVSRHTGLLTAGLVDAHTHAVWAGSRATEYAMRMAGADYEKIAAAGGGIVASTKAVRASSEEQLYRLLVGRLQRMAALGVTTVEVKSGYGLDEANERKQLEAIRRAGQRNDLPAVVSTFLGLHAVPPEAMGDKDAHAQRCLQWLEGIARDDLADFVDAYIERSAFSVEQTRPVVERARELGLGVRLHVGQFADVGGVSLAVEVGAASVDHVEHISPDGARALAEAGIAAVMLPVASFTLAQQPPPVAMLREAGVPLVVASDANPGTAPTESLPLAMALAVRMYGMSVQETLQGVTELASSSLGGHGGRLAEGAPADFVLWDLGHEDELVQPWGTARARSTWRAGRCIAGQPPD